MLLSICIPTFNRVNKVIRQIRFILVELNYGYTDIEVIVRDNNSSPYIYRLITEKFINEKINCQFKLIISLFDGDRTLEFKLPN